MPSNAHEAVGRAVSALGQAAQRLRPGSSKDKESRDQQRWSVVTIGGSSSDIAPDGVLPPPLALFGDAVEVELRPAPGSRGTELAARPTGQPLPEAVLEDPLVTAEDPRPALRQALRQVKQQVEVGEVLRSQPRPEGRRPSTLAGLLVDKAERDSDQGGVL